jgi:hypothetical protein
MEKIRNCLVIFLTGAVVLGFSLAGWLKKDEMYSYTERRTLAEKPEFTKETLLSGSYMTDFESYAMDQFPLRDTLRRWKAISSKYVFGQKDNQGYYVTEGSISKLEYPMQEDMLTYATDRFRYVYEKWISGSDCAVYLSVVPDKNAFQAVSGGYLSMDYDSLVENIREKMEYASYLDIMGQLSLENYYRTDPHWRQETLLPVAETLLAGMGAGEEDGSGDDGEYTVEKWDTPFYGAYYGQAALPVAADTLCYLTSPVLDQCTVTIYPNGTAQPGQLYDMDKASGRDPYEMFLMGTEALVVIENPNAETDGELILFRDSFGSSLAPLLVSSYAKITLVDLRYIQSSALGNFISFENQDVLFLYSTLVLNNSLSLR